MCQTESVTEFMYGGLFNSFQENVGIRWLVIKLWIKPMCGDEETFPLDLCQSEDILQDGHIDINMSNTHKP